ncbi:MAG TPA: MarR family transcriptional regulator [Acidimicrobiales bacterium]|nr:MarR family transcriptional regulator [Acidimicrobiales bacterium]
MRRVSADTGQDAPSKTWANDTRRIFDAWRELRRGPMRLLRQELYGTGADALDPAQVDSLEVIVTRDGWRMSEFANALHIDPSTATRMINRLVHEGMVDRAVTPDDGRVVIIRATPKGVSECARIHAGRRQLMERFLAGFTPGEVATLAELMGRLADGVALVARESRLEQARLEQD